MRPSILAGHRRRNQPRERGARTADPSREQEDHREQSEYTQFDGHLLQQPEREWFVGARIEHGLVVGCSIGARVGCLIKAINLVLILPRSDAFHPA